MSYGQNRSILESKEIVTSRLQMKLPSSPPSTLPYANRKPSDQRTGVP